MISTPDNLVKFYSNPILYNTKKLIQDDYKKVFIEGKKAYLEGLAINENPYSENDDTYIYSSFDIWREGFLSQERY